MLKKRMHGEHIPSSPLTIALIMALASVPLEGCQNDVDLGDWGDGTGGTGGGEGDNGTLRVKKNETKLLEV